MTTERSTRSAPRPSAAQRDGARDDVFALIERLPFIGSVAKEVTHLRALLVDRRPPEFWHWVSKVSGKSGLANALLGAEVLNALPAPAADVAKPDDAAKAEAPVAEPTSDAPPQAAPEGPQVDAGFPVVHGAWMRVTAVGRQLAWLELNAGEAERESMRLLQNALEEHVPDVLLVLVRAEDVEVISRS